MSSEYTAVSPSHAVHNFSIDDEDDDDNHDYNDQHDHEKSDGAGAIEMQPQQGGQASDEVDAVDGGGLQPMHISSGDEEETVSSYKSANSTLLFSWSQPWLPSVGVTLFLTLPLLGTNMGTFVYLTGRTWPIFPFSLHLLVTLLIQYHQVSTTINNTDHTATTGLLTATLHAIPSLTDIVFFGGVYPVVWHTCMDVFFIDVDGTPIVEWSHLLTRFQRLLGLAKLLVLLRILFGSIALATRMCHAFGWCSNNRTLGTVTDRLSCKSSLQRKRSIQQGMLLVVGLSALVAFSVTAWSFLSVVSHFTDMWGSTITNDNTANANCDPMDETECWLPFPSFHHMTRDPSAATGWRVNLQAHLLPKLRGGISIDPHYMNHMDGFSTMGPIMFYMDGLKEAHEAGLHQLQGSPYLNASTTEQSITLLVDIEDEQLIAHSAEIDYLDPSRPLVLVFPAQPLKHGGHYALAVVNAKDEHGQRLPPTKGMTQLFGSGTNDNADNKVGHSDISERQSRFQSIVIPTLQRAADSWMNLASDPTSLQLLFDFVTASEQAQLGPVRSVVDSTLSHVTADDWKWKEHVRTIRVDDFDCKASSSNGLARTVHAELDVPWFLADHGPGHRDSVLDMEAVFQRVERSNGQSQTSPVTLGTAKFVMHIPCSVRAAILNRDENPIRAVMEYGHGLFYNRDEATDSFLIDMANEQQYIITAMDWRGMSAYDLPLVMKVLLAKPSLFQSVVDNIVQGFANKVAHQSLTRSLFLYDGVAGGGGFDEYYTDCFAFADEKRSGYYVVMSTQLTSPTHVFYGISQGGILGAGYLATCGTAAGIDLGILGVPGTPFAMIMTRSLDFAGYDALMLRNFYNNRQVRLFLALAQMGWDSVEGSGSLATPVNRDYPPILLQAGLGDPVVPTMAAEALARGLDAVVLASHPRTIYGIDVAPEAFDDDRPTPDYKVVLTELLYKKEYTSLPVDDTPPTENEVHYCVRKDPSLMQQVKEFINTGHASNVCLNDGCVRDEATC